MCTRRFFIIASLVIGVYGCSDTRQPPTAPSALNMETPTICGPAAPDYELGMRACDGEHHVDQRMDVFDAGVSCPGSRVVVQDVGVGVGQVTVAPGNFRSTVTGSTVRLDWNPVLEPVITYLVQAGSAPGLSNLATLVTGNAAASLVGGRRPRGPGPRPVRGVGPDNIPGPASNEIVVSVGSGCASAPGSPVGLNQQVTGNTVNLTWQTGAGDLAATYIVEAGSSPGQNNIVVFDTGNAATALTAIAPNGTYFVRVRGRNSCGAGPASNEVIVTVPSGAPQPVPPITNLVPQVAVSAATLGPPTVVVGPRPNAGAGPTLTVQPAPATNDILRSFRLTASQPFDSIIVTGDTVLASTSLRPEVVADGYYLIRLASPQTGVDLTLTAGQSFTAQFAVALGAGPVGQYVSGAVNLPPTRLLVHRDADISDDSECRQHIHRDRDDWDRRARGRPRRRPRSSLSAPATRTGTGTATYGVLADDR